MPPKGNSSSPATKITSDHVVSLNPTTEVDGLDLHLAWRRVKLDRPDRCFVNHPHLFSWIEADLDAWIGAIAGQLRAGYAPRDCATCYEPKGGWMVRPGAVLELSDELAFNAIIGSLHPQLWRALSWSQGDPDMAYQLQGAGRQPDWLKIGFIVWEEWRKKSLEKLAEGHQFVLCADIAGFYENIDLSRVRSDVSGLDVDPAIIDLLMTCLHRWSQPRGKGIPQGYSASDILAKLYMNPVDLGLRNAGFTHLRYVDDFRIFCKTSLEAKRALLKLSDLLRHRGLNLQSAKTEILRVGEARRKIDGVAPVIHSIGKQLRDELKKLYKYMGPYGTLGDIDRFIRLNPKAPPPEVLERAFQENFSSGAAERFDKTLFHFLLTRLGQTKSRIAIRYCLDLISGRPEETKAILRYLGQVELRPDESEVIVAYATSADAIYDYQLYLIVQWFFGRNTIPSRILALCRTWAFDRNREQWLRTYAVAVLGLSGDTSDLEMIEHNYGSASTELERAEIITALARLESGRRNALYGRAKNDGELPKRAIARVRQQLKRV